MGFLGTGRALAVSFWPTPATSERRPTASRFAFTPGFVVSAGQIVRSNWL